MLEFQTDSSDGLLFYSGQEEDGSGDFISLALVDNHVELRWVPFYVCVKDVIYFAVITLCLLSEPSSTHNKYLTIWMVWRKGALSGGCLSGL